MMRQPVVGSYRDADGAGHELVVAQDRRRRLAGARHRAPSETRGSSTRSTGDQDGRPQAEAIARDYLTHRRRHEPGPGPAAARSHT